MTNVRFSSTYGILGPKLSQTFEVVGYCSTLPFYLTSPATLKFHKAQIQTNIRSFCTAEQRHLQLAKWMKPRNNL